MIYFVQKSFSIQQKRRGFTLVEILVVLAIIMSLAALLFPVFARVRENGRKASCQSNLKQLALSVQEYVADHGHRYPSINGFREALSPYVKSEEIYYCPSQKQHRPDKDTYQYNSFRLNRAIANPEPFPSIPTTLIGRNETSVPEVTTIWLQSDMGHDWNDNDGFVAVRSSCTDEIGRIGILGVNLHSGGGNYSFLDGHVKWLTPQALGETECRNPVYDPNNAPAD